MRKYKSYKSSGVDWFENIPSEWEIEPLKTHFRFKKGKNAQKYTKQYVLDNVGHFPVYSGQTEDEGVLGKINSFEYDLVEPVLFSTTVGAKAMTLFMLNGKFTLSQNCALIIPNSKKISIYFYYYFIQRLFDYERGLIALITQPSLRFEDLIKYKIVLPPLSEQNSIVKFLDYKTDQINSFITNRYKQIDLLEEQKAAIINKIVTKGINADAKMKNSGVEWIGVVPEHWMIIKLKYIIKAMASGVSVNSTDEPAESFEFGILKTSCVYSGEFNPKENKKILENEYPRMACPVKGNTIIMSRMNTPELVGANGFVDKDYKNLFLPDRLWQTVFFKKAQIVPKWLSYFMASHRFRTLLSSLATGTSASMKNITQEDVLGSPISLPPIEEQYEMCIFFENETSIIDTLISKYQKQIDLMQEYRTSLISQAVTGKIDVRDWRPKVKA